MELLHFEMSCDQINLDFCMEKEENSRNAKDTHTHIVPKIKDFPFVMLNDYVCSNCQPNAY